MSLDQLGRLVLLVAGAGRGAVVAEAAAREGVRRFILVDGDRIDLGLLQLPGLSRRDLGMNRASALVERLTEMQPEVSIQVESRPVEQVA